MTHLTKILSLALIVTALASGIFVIGLNAPAQKNSGGAHLDALAKIQSAAVATAEPLASLNQINALTPPAADNSQAIKIKYQSAANITESLASKIAQEFIKKNPGGPTKLGGQRSINAAAPEQLVNEAIKNELADFNPSQFQPVINIEKIRTSPTSSKADLENYLKKFQSILAANKIKIPATIAGNSAATFQATATALEKIIAEFYQLAAPLPLAELHASEISFLEAEKNIFEALAETKTDQLKSLLAARALPVINKQLSDLEIKFVDFINKNGLTL